VAIGWGAAYKYCDLMVFKLAAVHHRGFFKYEILAVNRVKRINMHHCAKFWGEWLNRCWDMMIYSFFSKWRLLPSWICCMNNYMDHSWRVFVGLDHCAKFGWNQCHSFDNITSFNILWVRLENAYSRPPKCGFERFDPQLGSSLTATTNRHLLMWKAVTCKHVIYTDCQNSPQVWA